MKEDHANMPGMDHSAKKAEPGKAAAPPQKAAEPKKPDASPPSGKNKPS